MPVAVGGWLLLHRHFWRWGRGEGDADSFGGGLWVVDGKRMGLMAYGVHATTRDRPGPLAMVLATGRTPNSHAAASEKVGHIRTRATRPANYRHMSALCT